MCMAKLDLTNIAPKKSPYLLSTDRVGKLQAYLIEVGLAPLNLPGPESRSECMLFQGTDAKKILDGAKPCA